MLRGSIHRDATVRAPRATRAREINGPARYVARAPRRSRRRCFMALRGGVNIWTCGRRRGSFSDLPQRAVRWSVLFFLHSEPAVAALKNRRRAGLEWPWLPGEPGGFWKVQSSRTTAAGPLLVTNPSEALDSINSKFALEVI